MAESLTQDQDKTVLIASNSFDEALIRPVATGLERRGYRVVTYEADKVASGETALSIEIDTDGLDVRYGHQPLVLSGLKAAWYRRPNIFGGIQQDKAKQVTIDKERKALQEILWSSVPEKAWLNAPQKMERAADKLGQLLIAQALGFNTPHTVVSNQWQDILALPADKVALKMPYGIMYENNQHKSLYTTIFDNREQPFVDANPFPGIWQSFIPKGREWRITIVGDEAFDVAIYTDEHAKDDWRKHQFAESGVEFRAERFPDGAKERCFQLLNHWGLRYGALDFIEDDQGELTFLELNPNGQYGWLEHKLEIPISQAISSQLIKIAEAA